MVKVTKQLKLEYIKFQEAYTVVEEEVLSSIWLLENFPSNIKQVLVLLVKAWQDFGFLVQDFYGIQKMQNDGFDVLELKDCVDDVLKKSLKEKDYQFWNENYKDFFDCKDLLFVSQSLPEKYGNVVEKFQLILSIALNYLIKEIQKKYHYDFKSICWRNKKWFFIIALLLTGFWYQNKANKYETYNFMNWKDFDDAWSVTSLGQDWGSLKKGASVEGNACKVGSKIYKNCYGTHAVSKIKINFEPKFVEFSGGCGKDKESNHGSVKCKILDKNNNVLFESDTLTNDSEAHSFSIPVKGLDGLILEINDADDGISFDHADWVDLQLK